MAQTFAPDARRDTAATALAASSYCWPRVTLKRAVGAFRASEQFYGVPSSQPGRYYLTNARFCSCPDYQQRGSGCKHQRAALLHLAAIEAAEAEADFDGMLEGVAAIKAAFGSEAGAVVQVIR